MLAGCFIVDIHSSTYHEQAFTHNYDTPKNGVPPIPLSGATEELWQAPNADSWAALVAAKGPLLPAPAYLSDIEDENITAESVRTYAVFDQAIILTLEAIRMPQRKNPTQLELTTHIPPTEGSSVRIVELFPGDPVMYTYMALHYTPLYDLLAVSGDSWVFSQKVLQSTSFIEHQRRLKQWTNSGTAVAAVVFASRSLTAWFRNPYGRPQALEADGDISMCDISAGRNFKDNICDYWAMYVCALICWAYCHRPNRSGQDVPAASGEEDAGAVWARNVAAMQPAEVKGLRAGRKGAGCVVALVRKWLERDCLGAKSRLFVDAVCVLKKLEEGVNWKWF
jgi:hypothetical protein